METDNNNELRLQVINKYLIKHLYTSTADTISIIISVHDITKDIYPTPVINYLYALLSSNTITKNCLNEILDIVAVDKDKTELIDIIRQEMNI